MQYQTDILKNKGLIYKFFSKKTVAVVGALTLVVSLAQPLAGYAENDNDNPAGADQATVANQANQDSSQTNTNDTAATAINNTAPESNASSVADTVITTPEQNSDTSAIPDTHAPSLTTVSSSKNTDSLANQNTSNQSQQEIKPDPCASTGHQHLTGLVTDRGEAEVTNHSDKCQYNVGLASYKMFDDNIDHQQLFDSHVASIHPGQTLHLKVKLPDCAWQMDLFQGVVIESFAGGIRYGPRLIDGRQALNPPPFCKIIKPEIDLAVEKSVNVDTPFEGQTIMYFVTVTNHGPDTATNVLLTDVLPDGITFVEAKTTTSSFTKSEWHIDRLAPDETQTLKITVTVDAKTAAQRIINTATVSADEHDTDQSNNTAHVLIIPISRPDPCRPAGHENLTGSLTNTGEATITNHSEKCQYNVGLASYKMFDDNIDHQQLFDSHVASIHPGQTLHLKVKLPDCAWQMDLFQGVVIESFAGGIRYGPRLIDGQQAFNPPPFCVVSKPTADLAITKTVSITATREQQSITYTISVVNNGPDAATAAQVSERFPAGLTYVSSTTTVGTYDHATRLWTIGRLERHQRVSLQISATVGTGRAGQTITNAVAVESVERDPDLANNQASVDIAVPRPTPPPTGGGGGGPVSGVSVGGGGGSVLRSVDLVLTKTADRNSASQGETTVFTISLTNRGPDGATNVDVAESLSSGLTFLSAVASQGTYIASTGHWNVGSVAVNTPVTLTLRAYVNGTTSCTNLVNTATASSPDSERNQADNSASVSVGVPCVGGSAAAPTTATPPPEVLSARTELPRTGLPAASMATMVALLFALPFAWQLRRRETERAFAFGSSPLRGEARWG